VVFNTALTDEQIQRVSEWLQAYVGVKAKIAASGSSPADGAVDVSRDTILGWTPVATAVQRDVYFGTFFQDVNNADSSDPMNVLVSQGQNATTYDPGRLEFGRTYYWRIDEVNGAPDNTVFKGDVWGFTVEQLAYPIVNVVATSDAVSDEGAGPANTVNGSGLGGEDQHSVESNDMWVAAPAGEEPVSITFQFDRVHKLHELLIWNYNVQFELLLGFGIKTATVEYSVDGTDWTILGECEIAQATASPTYTANTTVDFGGVAARYVRLTVVSGYGLAGKFGLSEVRFLSIPVHASKPDPAAGTTDVSVDTSLGWRAGREAAVHDVHLGTDLNALTLIDSVADSTLNPGPLDLATTYYWRVDEVNEVEAVSTWEGESWRFATQEYIIVDDFESYNDEDNLIYEVWIDGWTNETGSTVGYLEAPFAERSVVHSGVQSMPLFYDNIGGGISEANFTFTQPQDWTLYGIKGLLLWFYGDPDNTSVQLYVKINNVKVAYDGDADNLLRKPWQLWYIDLTDLNVSSVTELTIGLEGNGTGHLFIDDVMLTPYDRQQISPVEPDPANLVAHLAFDGDTSDSTGAHPGTATGTPDFMTGKIGQAISLNGTGEYVELTGYQGVLGTSAVTVAAWINTTSTATGAVIGWGPNVGGQRFGFRVDLGRLRFEHHAGNVQGGSIVNDGAWHHVAVTVRANATASYPDVTLWLDGQDDTLPTVDLDPPLDLTADLDVRIGSRPASDDRFFMGEIDELYLYDRALSQAEIAYLAGRIRPFDVD